MDPEAQKRSDRRRRWLAVALATAIMLMSYLLFLWGFSAGADESVLAGGVIGIGLGLVPGVFVVAAFVSRHPRALRGAGLATLLWLGITLPIGLVTLPVALVAGFGGGGVIAFRRDPVHSLRYRWIAVGLCVAYTLVLLLVWPVAGLLGGAALPFLAIAYADFVAERAAEAADPTPDTGR